jgi:ribonuclease R
MPKSQKPKDPFAKRESDNYANPVASREFILEQLELIAEPVGLDQLVVHLKITDEEQIEGLRRRLIAMSRDGQIISNRRGVYGLASLMELTKGRIQGHKDGFGFFIPEGGGDDFFLSPREMDRLFDGDKVLARHIGFDSRGRKEGTIVEILERRYSQIVGRFYHEQGFGIVVPDSKRIPHEIIIPEAQIGSAKDGEFVVAELIEYPAKRKKAVGKIVEILGDVTTPGLEIDMAVRSHDIPHEWPTAVTTETSRFSDEVGESEFQDRFDLRQTPFVTIDGEDAKDFDDAVFAESKKSGGWTLFVAIADVSNYVKIGSALDREAINRGTSVYFPGHVIPMLPEKLSNGLCSLKPNVDRLTLVCEMQFAATGEMQDYDFYEAVIHSHGRLTYTEVADMLQPAEGELRISVQEKLLKRHKPIIPHLKDLYSLYHALRSIRDKSGAMDFESTETRIVFGENKKIREIVPVERNEAHRLIEECMLRANVAAARLLEEKEVPALYRIHEGPNPDKLKNLRDFLKEMDMFLGGGDEPEPMDYQKVLAQMDGRPDKHLLQTMLIRSMMQAVYQPENVGHFGLGYDAYAHFTSPIRRYPDLLVHRAIRYLVRNKKGKHLKKHKAAKGIDKKSIYPYEMKDMISFGENCSIAERRADAASYSVIDWLKCEYMQDHVGEEFTGTVASVTSFGLFVELNDIYIEGLVHITELTNDYYHFDPVRHCLQGERTQKVYRLGDTVDVCVVRVNLDEKKIDLQMQGSRSAVPGTKKSGLREALRTGKVGKGNSGKGKDSRKKIDSGKEGTARRSRGGEKTAAGQEARGGSDGGAPKKKGSLSQSKRASQSKPGSQLKSGSESKPNAQSKPTRSGQPSKTNSGGSASASGAPKKAATRKKPANKKASGVAAKRAGSNNPAAGPKTAPGTAKAKKRANRSGAAKKRVKAKAKSTQS